MVINVSVQYNGGLLPDIILLATNALNARNNTNIFFFKQQLLTLPYVTINTTGALKSHKDVLTLQPMIPPNNKRFDIPPPCVG